MITYDLTVTKALINIYESNNSVKLFDEIYLNNNALKALELLDSLDFERLTKAQLQTVIEALPGCHEKRFLTDLQARLIA